MKVKTLAFVVLMGMLAWLFTSMFFWTLDKNRAANPREAPSVYQRILGIDKLQWDALTLQQQQELLEKRRETLESLPAEHPDRVEILPQVYYWMATVASRRGEGSAALEYLDQAGIIPGSEDWYYLLRGAALEAQGNKDEALDAYLTSFSHRLLPVVWGKLQQFGLSAAELIARTREKLVQRSRPFPPFSLKSPDGKPMGLKDFAGKVILVNFFFPG